MNIKYAIAVTAILLVSMPIYHTINNIVQENKIIKITTHVQKKMDHRSLWSLVQQAHIIVVGTVESQLKSDSLPEGISPDSLIWSGITTTFRFRVEEYIKSTSPTEHRFGEIKKNPGDILKIITSGGTHEGTLHISDEGPLLKPSKRYILFLQNNSFDINARKIGYCIYGIGGKTYKAYDLDTFSLIDQKYGQILIDRGETAAGFDEHQPSRPWSYDDVDLLHQSESSAVKRIRQEVEATKHLGVGLGEDTHGPDIGGPSKPT
jgi:hypothetical protein